MKLAKTLIVIVLLSALQACAVSDRSAKLVVPSKPPQLRQPDTSLVTKCLGPVTIGDGALAQDDVERLWITDHQLLLNFARRHAALRDFYIDRDAGLRGTPLPIERPKP